MKFIPLTKGYVAIVDDADYEHLSRYRWEAMVKPNTVYAVRHEKCDGRNVITRMHRQLLSATPEYQVDHKNGCGIDNRRENLRLCTSHQNQQNRRATRARKATQYKGVDYVPARLHNQWGARLKTNGRIFYLGWFDTDSEAARAYNAAAIERFGEFACLNEIPG